ncbi:MAG: hypothetical protein AAFW98_18875 [Pseudomonadota bacterium]
MGWIANANSRRDNGLTDDSDQGTTGLTSPGKVSGTRSSLRWVHKDYSTRRVMPAADTVLAIQPDQFPCS